MSYLQNFKYELSGPENGIKLVFLHGVMGSGANWRKITPAFQNEYRILTFDQRGHGWSFKPANGYAPEDYAYDLKMILDELGWQEVVLVGHSMGGRNALHFASLYPSRVKALVIEDIGPEGNPAAMQKTLDLVQMVPVPFVTKAAAKKYFEEDFVLQLGGGESARVLGQYFYTNIEQKSEGHADWRFAKEAIFSSLISGHFKPRWDAVRDLQVPTLFIRGGNSADFTRAEFEKVLSVNPRIQGVEIAGSGHWVHFDKPLEFIQAVKEFVVAIFGRAG
jgi:esterase